MTGLPRAKDTSRPRDLVQIMVFGSIERLTESLRRGDAFDQRSLVELQHLQQRCEAFSDALDGRLRQAFGDADVLEDDK